MATLPPTTTIARRSARRSSSTSLGTPSPAVHHHRHRVAFTDVPRPCDTAFAQAYTYAPALNNKNATTAKILLRRGRGSALRRNHRPAMTLVAVMSVGVLIVRPVNETPEQSAGSAGSVSALPVLAHIGVIIEGMVTFGSDAVTYTTSPVSLRIFGSSAN